MGGTRRDDRRDRLAARYGEVRGTTETLAAPLSPEDQTVQSMPDVSPTKWHRAHTSWFFETFLLDPHLPGYLPFHPAFGYIFNSYYEAVGARHPRPDRGLISRPGVAEVTEYREHVDRAMTSLLERSLPAETLDLVELGLHHEQQHQELLLMDIKHVLHCSPLRPAYVRDISGPGKATAAQRKARWIEHQGGEVEIGHAPGGFSFDNEEPRHPVLLAPFALADRPVTCGEWLAFIEDGGYERPELWLSDGWALIRQEAWRDPLYWSASDEGPRVYTLRGERDLDPAEPVCHVSYYEADAYANWAGARLPTESEWEAVASSAGTQGNMLGSLDTTPLHPEPPGAGASFFGDVWEWTSSAYSPYPGFRPAAGAVGEYNGKFMVNQYVLRGGSCVTPDGHVRLSYRNFFPAAARWPFTGLRLARDL